MPMLSKCFPCLNKKEEIVSKLDFTNVTINEEFSLVWQHERTLENLCLVGTRLSSLPPQLFYCQALRILNLSNNNLENIPNAIGTLRHLQNLNLSKNFLSSVPENLKDCRNLTHLDLSCNHFQRIPEPITCLLNLQELFLNETYLEFLPANFGRLVNLRILELRLNSLITLPKSMARLSNLKRLDIGGNEFTELPEVVGDLYKLRELWIDFNQIRRITPNIAKLQDLQHFEANGNVINELPSEIGHWRYVEVFSVGTNTFKSLPKTIGMLKALVTFKCDYGELEELPNSISELENLEELVLSHNRLTSLPTTIGTLRKLRYLFADDNKLRTLPDELCSCSSLSVLSVSQNQLACLPVDIGRLNNLKVLNVVDNAIVSLPVSVLNLCNLTSMWISDNQTQPLVPMQYADGTTKDRLTCFMLPQNRASTHLLGQSDDSGACKQSEAQTSASHLNNISKQHPAQVNAIPVQTKKYPRSIGFVDDALQTFNDSNTTCHKFLNSSQENVEEHPFEIGSRLMRSPTPYPKELRLMAKYMRTGQKISEKTPQMHEVKEAHVLISNESQQMFNKANSSSQTNYYQVDNLQGPQALQSQQYFELISPLTTHNEMSNYLVNNQSVDLDSNIIAQMAYLSTASSNEDTTSQNLYATYYTAAPQGELIGQVELPQLQQQFVCPPPYHIARNFTKKTPEDLYNYETMRKNQILLQGDLSVSSLNVHVNSYNCNHTEKIACPAQNEVVKNKFDNQNNVLVEQTVCPESSSIQNSHERQLQQPQHLQKYTNHDDVDGIIRSSCKKKTPWLFGKHKNPTVKQVNIKCDNNEPGFTIGNMNNEEGIFVLTVDLDSSASRLLSVNDKILEINGHDLTNGNLEEAKQILLSTGGLVSIMLSRK